MFVDKPLTGLHAVQTLSRLNRIHPDEDGHVRPRLPQRRRGHPGGVQALLRRHRRDPDRPEPALRHPPRPRRLRRAPRRRGRERRPAARLARQRARPPQALRAPRPGRRTVQGARRRSSRTSSETALRRFVHVYAFLSQIVSFADTRARTRLPLLPRARDAPAGSTRGPPRPRPEVELTHLRLEKTFEGSVSLDHGEGEVRDDLRRARPAARAGARAPLADHRDHQRAVRPQAHRRRPAPVRPVRAGVGRRSDARRAGQARTTSPTSASRSTRRS